MFLLLFTGVGLGEIYVIKNPLFFVTTHAKSLPGTAKPSVIPEEKFSHKGIER